MLSHLLGATMNHRGPVPFSRDAHPHWMQQVRMWFPDGAWRHVYNTDQKTATSTFFYDFFSPELNLSIIAVRGTYSFWCEVVCYMVLVLQHDWTFSLRLN